MMADKLGSEPQQHSEIPLKLLSRCQICCFGLAIEVNLTQDEGVVSFLKKLRFHSSSFASL